MPIGLQDRRVEVLSNLIIANAATASGLLSADQFGRYESLTIYAPAALTGTVTLQVLGDPDADETDGASWRALQSPPGTDITVPAGKAITISPLNALAIRLLSSGSEGAERTFRVTGRLQRVASP